MSEILDHLLATKQQIRLSHYALELLQSCDRQFQIERLMTESRRDQDSEHFAYGRSFGAGVQSYLQDGDLDKALWIAFYQGNWQVETDKKPFLGVMAALISQQYVLDTMRSEWEVAVFDGKPAIELGFRLQIDELFYYAGFMDLVMKHKEKGSFAVVEIKSTGLKLHDLNPVYCHSGQSLGYSVILDTMIGKDLAEFDLLYVVNQCPDPFAATLKILTFPKTLLDRLNWFMTLQMDCQRIRQMLELDYFPKRGSSCLKYNRPCFHFGVCQMHGADKYHLEAIDPHEKDYQFRFNIADIITDHLARVSK